MKKTLLILFINAHLLITAQEITPAKFNSYQEALKSNYAIPASSRFTINRTQNDAPQIVYYISKPHNCQTYPIAIVCGGSTGKNDIGSIIHVHRYFLQEFLDLGCAVITIEQWGVDGDAINKEEFTAHYTRTQRLNDHQRMIEHWKQNPPSGWNGKLIFLGVSEGGPLVTTLTEMNPSITAATINWSGAGDWSWRDELWSFLCALKKNAPWSFKLRIHLPRWFPGAIDFPKTRAEYDHIMNETLQNPDPHIDFLGMTYQYHADALRYPAHDYQKLKTPFLVVAGAQDSIIQSCDSFVQKAVDAGANITYLRIDDMDHYVRRRPEVVEQSFAWLKHQLQ